MFVEPAAAVSVAGALRARAEGHLDPDQRVVCILTGHGFKDPDAIASANRSRGIANIAAEDITIERFGDGEHPG